MESEDNPGKGAHGRRSEGERGKLRARDTIADTEPLENFLISDENYPSNAEELWVRSLARI